MFGDEKFTNVSVQPAWVSTAATDDECKLKMVMAVCVEDGS